VEVEVPDLAVRVVVEAVDDTGWGDDERARRRLQRSVRSQERQLAVEHVERVGVPAMDVQRCAALPRSEPRLGHPDLLEVGFDQDGAPLPHRDLLALVPSQNDRVHRGQV
jgi:hypothetical protein